MFTVSLSPLPEKDQDEVASWAKQPEAQCLLSAAKGRRAEHLAKAAEMALADSKHLLANKCQLPLDSIEPMAQAARYTIFLEVWNELTHVGPLQKARVEIT